MGFSINDFYNERIQAGDPESRLLQKILALPDADEARAETLFAETVKQAPETLLVELLKHPHGRIQKFCINALWEIWFNEKGEEARQELLMGIRALSDNKLSHALQLFESTVCRYPGWAEPINKAATVYYLMRRPQCGIKLCKAVLKIKPHHFGAWNGLVHCAVETADWELAVEALQSYWKLCPHAADAVALDRIIREHTSD